MAGRSTSASPTTGLLSPGPRATSSLAQAPVPKPGRARVSAAATLRHRRGPARRNRRRGNRAHVTPGASSAPRTAQRPPRRGGRPRAWSSGVRPFSTALPSSPTDVPTASPCVKALAAADHMKVVHAAPGRPAAAARPPRDTAPRQLRLPSRARGAEAGRRASRSRCAACPTGAAGARAADRGARFAENPERRPIGGSPRGRIAVVLPVEVGAKLMNYFRMLWKVVARQTSTGTTTRLKQNTEIRQHQQRDADPVTVRCRGTRRRGVNL